MVRKVGLTFFTVLFAAASYLLLFVDPGFAGMLAKEDGFYEYLTAFFFFLTSVLCLAAFLRDREGNDLWMWRPGKNVFFLLLSAAFFFGFGEEISWGQRIFHFSTPGWMGETNLQGEANIHNLELFHRMTVEGEQKSGLRLLLNFDRLFALFWFVYCFLIPLGARASAPFLRFLKKVNLPLVSLSLGVLFPSLYLATKAVEWAIGGSSSPAHWPLMEMKECLFASLFFLVGLHFAGKKPA